MGVDEPLGCPGLALPVTHRAAMELDSHSLPEAANKISKNPEFSEIFSLTTWTPLVGTWGLREEGKQSKY